MSSQPPTIVDREALTDEELMLAYQKGDVRSFDLLITRYQREIYNFIYRFLNDAQGAEEAFQEVFERVLRSAASYSPQAKFSTWVYTIARNFCIDTFRKKKLRHNVSLEEPLGSSDDTGRLEDVLPDDAPKPDQEASAHDLENKLAEALSRINPDQRDVFLMRDQQGLQFDEIAEIIGVSVNTVKSRMRYALQALQEEFKKIGIMKPK